jgi:DhnA family fructose-bisphosphate aldolase class Ia
VEVVVDPRLESLQNHAVGTFYLPIRHGVCHGSPVHPDVVVFAEVQELSASELGAVVSDDGVRDPEAMDDVGEECHCLFRLDAV